MRVGQRNVVRCQSRFAFGDEGRPAIGTGDRIVPPNADLELDVFLSEIVSSKSTAEMTPEENLADCQFRKAVGNEHFQCKDFKKAIRSYVSALKAIGDNDFPKGSEEYQEARKLQIDCGNNVANAFMRMNELEKAKESTVSVLQLDPDNVKALFRAGNISSKQGNFLEAKLALDRALEIDPQSIVIKAEMQRLAVLKKEYREKSKAMQKRMGESMFSSSDSQVGRNEALQGSAEGQFCSQEVNDIHVDTKSDSSPGSIEGSVTANDVNNIFPSAVTKPKGLSLHLLLSLFVLLVAVAMAVFYSRATTYSESAGAN
ncbi:unnamed protein product [Discosporangium mesarthrocarpum]